MTNCYWDGKAGSGTACGDNSLPLHVSFDDWSVVSCPDCLKLRPPSEGGFVVKDSGKRVDYPSGMRRDVDTGKPRYDLIPTFMLKRLAELYARGAEKYGEENYALANSNEELRRFKASAFRHFIQWLDGERDEDHGAAVFFNITAAELVTGKLASE